LSWITTGATPSLALSGLSTDAAVDLTVSFRFAHLTFAYAIGPVWVPAGTTVSVPVTLPPESKLDPLAESYVVRLDVSTGSQSAPALFVSWRDPAPVAWTAVERAAHAPRGVLDPTLDLAFAAQSPPPVWVDPPLAQDGLPVFEDDGAGVTP